MMQRIYLFMTEYSAYHYSYVCFLFACFCLQELEGTSTQTSITLGSYKALVTLVSLRNCFVWFFSMEVMVVHQGRDDLGLNIRTAFCPLQQ